MEMLKQSMADLSRPAGGANRDKGLSFIRVLRIVEAIIGSPSSITATEIANKTGVPRPSVVRLCHSLELEGLVSRELCGRRYMVGPGLCKLGSDIIAGAALQAERSLILRRLVDEIGETCNILLPERGAMVIADRIESNWAVRTALAVGTRAPLHSSASGMLFLASLAKAKRKSILKRLVLTPWGPNTITDPAVLEKKVEMVRRQGMCIDNQAYIDGLVSVAVPIHDERGRLCATLSAQGTEHRFSVEVARRHIPAMLRAAAELKALMQVS